VTDVWADWSTAAASNDPAGTATPEIDDEIRNIKAQCKTNLMAMADVQTVTGAKTFNTGTLKVQSTTAGLLMNSTAGVVTYGNGAAELPTGIDAAKIADGSVSNTEFQYLNGVTSAIQTQLSAVPAAASKAEQETGSEAAKYVAPATQQNHPSAAKAWGYVTYSGGTPTLVASYNVASIVDDGTGLLTINFTVPFSSADYACIANARSDNAHASPLNHAAGSVQINTCNTSGTEVDPTSLSFVAYGDQ
jgi:hypothetical protein